MMKLFLLCLIATMFSNVFCFQSVSSKLSTRSSSLNMISHGVKFNRLGRAADHRKALLRNLTTEVIRHGRIRTTLVKAKALRKPVDHMITLAKKGTLHHRRQALSYIFDKELVASLFEAAPERYGDRNGGYCRVLREDVPRRGDGTPMAIVELV